MHPALFYLPGERLSQPELSAARIDGHVVEIGEGYIPADLVESPQARAAGLAALIIPGLAASGPSAAWVHGAGDRPPLRHHAHRAVPHRVRAPQSARLAFHDTALEDHEMLWIGGIAVATPLRTMIDLLLGIHRDATLAVWAEALLEVLPPLLDEAGVALQSMHRVPGSRAARAEVDRLKRRL
ncbi:SAM-dependent methyltransferase [Microbacterium sp.]|uniref:SAM-dependent methyltransferase n=1 Tax=Microbacterium sp. TaxID=51671 RepID=UPI00281240F4|nr:SAM-dependent methyltransferase [Microbacterium sp.]